jgi:hypothetical protein
MPKNGRLFYGGEEGQVKELLFQDYSNSVLSVLMQETKRLGKVNHEQESLVSQLLPAFFKPAKCAIVKLEID